MKTPPFDLAASIWESEPCANTFEHDLLAHHRSGYVFSTPDYFIMGRPVDRYAEACELYDINFTPPRERQNAWLVWCLAGNITRALDNMPYRLPWVIFQRKNDLRVYPMERFESFLYNGSKPTHNNVAE